MILGIVSDCVHAVKNGKTGSRVHIFVRQMEALSKHFDKVIICCPFEEIAGNNITTYKNESISFIPLTNVGGDGLLDKLKLIAAIPSWLKAFYQLNQKADIIYQRFPNNLNIPGFFYFRLFSKKTFATYTGTWANAKNEPLSYTFQKWLLKKWFRGPVWVYSTNACEGKHIYSGFSPSYSEAEWIEEDAQVANRIRRVAQEPNKILKLISVGTLIWYKNQQYLLNTCVQLKEKNIPFHLTLVGDGPLKTLYSDFIEKYGLEKEVTMTGNIDFNTLRGFYRDNDFVVQSPLSEGFGKVPVEGFFHGVIPILNNISLAAYMTGNKEERGFLFDAAKENALLEILQQLYEGKYEHQLADMIKQGRIFAKEQTLENWSAEMYKKVIGYYE